MGFATLKGNSLSSSVMEFGVGKVASADACSSYCVVPFGPTGVQRMTNSTLLDTVLSARGCGTAGGAHGGGGAAAVKLLTVERTDGQLSKSASTDQVTGPAGAFWLSRCSADVVPITFGASAPAAAHNLYCVAPGTL